MNNKDTLFYLFYCFFCRSPSLLPKFPFVVIQKFCYHSNVTSHFSSLLCINIVRRKLILVTFGTLRVKNTFTANLWWKGKAITNTKDNEQLKPQGFAYFFTNWACFFFLLARPSKGELLERKSRLHPCHQMFFSYKNGQVRAILGKTHFDAPTDPGVKFHGLQLLNCLCVELLSNTFLFFLSLFFIKDIAYLINSLRFSKVTFFAFQSPS